ncbi:hypothetical protein Tco_1282006 [Tanacetum coccineum]
MVIRVPHLNFQLKIFSGKLKSRWEWPLHTSLEYFHLSALLTLFSSQRANFKGMVSVKHYIGGERTTLGSSDLQFSHGSINPCDGRHSRPKQGALRGGTPCLSDCEDFSVLSFFKSFHILASFGNPVSNLIGLTFYLLDH